MSSIVRKMKRATGLFCDTLSAIALAGVLLLWVRGYGTADTLEYGSYRRDREDEWGHVQWTQVTSCTPGIGVIVIRYTQSGPYEPLYRPKGSSEWRFRSPSRAAQDPFGIVTAASERYGGFGAGSVRDVRTVLARESPREFNERELRGIPAPSFELRTAARAVVAPYWFLAMVMAIRPAWRVHRTTQWWQRRRRSRRGLCPDCGYDLRATPDNCPECGSARSSHLNSQPRAAYAFRMVSVAGAIVLALIASTAVLWVLAAETAPPRARVAATSPHRSTGEASTRETRAAPPAEEESRRDRFRRLRDRAREEKRMRAERAATQAGE